MTSMPEWTPRLTDTVGPLYLQIASAIENDVSSGRLRPGDRLPSQRALADSLGIDMTTVTRAYAEGRRRRVLDAMTGRGSFVAARIDREAPPIDLAMIVPPRPRGLKLGEMLKDGLEEILLRSDADLVMSYHPGAGLENEKAAGAVWLEPVLGRLPPDRIAVSAGAQVALAAILSLNAEPGDTILCEALTYPGLIAVARTLRLKLVGVAMNEDGIDPDALRAAIARTGARIVCLTPSIQNPTGGTLPAVTRAAIAEMIDAAGITLIEDDPYALLTPRPPRAIAALVPSRSWYIATLSKALTPGLRIAFATAPNSDAAVRLAATLRALTQFPAPLMAALAARWIRSGAAAQLRDGVRAEAQARQVLARRILPGGGSGHPSGLHVWQTLPPHWDRKGLMAAARAHGLGLMPSDAFAVDPATAPDAVRLSLGAVADRGRLKTALETLARVIATRP